MVPNKIYLLLKTFIHEAYMHHLTAITLCNTTGQLGYVANQNMFNMFCSDNPGEQNTDNNAMTVTQTAVAATTGTSTLGITYATTASVAIPLEVTMAIKQLSAKPNRHHAADGNNVIQPPPAQHSNVHVPPMHNVQIPMQQTGGFQQGRGGR